MSNYQPYKSIILNHTVEIVNKEWLSHNMIRFVLEKPSKYKSTIGQAIELSLSTKDFADKFAPFTLTSLPEDDYLELMIKIYPDHKGLTLALSKRNINDEIIITDAWDSYKYKGAGTFIAGGSGITPFIPMIRNLKKNDTIADNRLIYANRNANDIIIKDELENALAKNFINILSGESGSAYDFGRINMEYLKKRIAGFNQFFYICGPDKFSESVKNDLLGLGAKENKIQIGY